MCLTSESNGESFKPDMVFFFGGDAAYFMLLAERTVISFVIQVMNER